jgi:AraC-like DNA-binding protein
LADVALACGFADQGHFTRVFSGATGLPPAAAQLAISFFSAILKMREIVRAGNVLRVPLETGYQQRQLQGCEADTPVF